VSCSSRTSTRFAVPMPTMMRKKCRQRKSDYLTQLRYNPQRKSRAEQDWDRSQIDRFDLAHE